eukprot:TRINITY_DN1199_c0_g2_i1.p1 TRINITY_DN1199_c0_g2~~TRINITY_DN1199_c0_g2_i1.p1  ORF type:complete len:197 (-),score=53.85 TRINITY_DN1199_c0_g2_i1:173-763(-)
MSAHKREKIRVVDIEQDDNTNITPQEEEEEVVVRKGSRRNSETKNNKNMDEETNTNNEGDAPSANQSKIQVDAEFLKGIPKSGKPWKKTSKKTSNLLNANVGMRLDWETKMKLKQERQELVDKIKKFKIEQERRREQRKKARKDKEKRKEINTMKSATYQIIKNTKKIKKWNRKTRSQLAKLPTEMFNKLLEKGKL